MNFWIIQLLDLIAWLLLIFSYYRENRKEILLYQIVATILYALHYYFLGAYTGLFVCIFEIVRDYMYFITDDDKDKYIFLITAPIYGIFGYDEKFGFGHCRRFFGNGCNSYADKSKNASSR